MSTTVGTIDLELLLNSKEFNKQLKNVNKTANKASNTISSSLLKIGGAVVAAFSVKKILDFGKSCINLGSDLAEVQNVVDVSFATMNESVNEFAQNAIEQFGLGQTVTKKYMGTFGAMSKAFGFAEKEAYEMSKTLTGLAGDVASFYNLSSDESYTKLKSVFTGETESLKDLGVVMTQNALDQYALANGYGKTTSAMSEQEKVALRYKFVTDQLSLASGDFVRTQDSWANQTRVLTLRFQEFKATIGQGLINLFTPVIKVINTVLAKLQVLANAFKSFTDFITGNKNSDSGVGGIATDLSSVTSNANNASNAVDGIGSSAKKAAKDMKSLMGFDTAQILKTDNDSDSSSGSSGGEGGSIDFGSLSDLSNSVEESTALMNPHVEKLRELSDIFKKGFEISFGDTNFDGILLHLKNIKKSILDIFYNQKVLNAAQTWIKTTTYALGQMVGAVSRIGVNIAEGLLGSIDLYFSKNSKRIQDFIIKAFYISKDQFLFLGAFFEAVGEISDVFKSDTVKQIGADIIAIFTNPFMSVLETIGKFISDVEAILVVPIIDNVEKIKLAIENTLQPIKTVTDTLAECFTYVGEKWVEIYDSHIHPLLDSIKTGLTDTFSKFLDVYNQYVAPALQRMADRFNELWNLNLKPFFDNLGDLIGSISDFIKVFWETVLKPLIDWIIQNIVPKIVPVIERIWNVACDAIEDITNIIGKVIDTFRNIIDWITYLFRVWSSVWNSIKTVMSDAWDFISNTFSNLGTTISESITGAVKAGVNGMLSQVESKVNSFIKMLNNAITSINKIPGVNISKISTISIPKLANGGYFKANQPTLAVVGDNKRQSEIVSPMNKMEEAFENVLARKGLGANKEIVELLKVIIDLLNKLGLSIIIDLDGEELSYRLKKIDKQNEFCRNGG